MLQSILAKLLDVLRNLEYTPFFSLLLYNCYVNHVENIFNFIIVFRRNSFVHFTPHFNSYNKCLYYVDSWCLILLVLTQLTRIIILFSRDKTTIL